MSVALGAAFVVLSYAIALLARRDYSSRELTRKLEERGYLENAIVPVVDDEGMLRYFVLAKAHQAVVDEDAGQLFADRFVQECGHHR